MSIQLKYQAYHSSMLKLLGFIGSTALVSKVSSSKYFDSTNISIGAGLYFAHNLYAQYAHNASQENQIKVTTNGDTKLVDISPQYFDSYSVYNLSGLIYCLGKSILPSFSNKNFIPHSEKLPEFFNEHSGKLLGLAIISKLASICTSDCRDLTLTDHETGEIIPHEIILFSNLNDQ